jgi:hypothetical protein
MNQLHVHHQQQKKRLVEIPPNTVPVESIYDTEEILINIDEIRLNLQTLLSPENLEQFLSIYIYGPQAVGLDEQVQSLLVSLREISQYSYELVKDRMREFTEAILSKLKDSAFPLHFDPKEDSTMLTGGSHGGLNKLSVIVEDQRDPSTIYDNVLAKEIQEEREIIREEYATAL